MDIEEFQKHMFSTNRREKIFNVRKVPYKQFDNEKYLKSHVSPFPKHSNNFHEPSTTQHPRKGGQYNFPVAIISSNAYKELNKKYMQLRDYQNLERERRNKIVHKKQDELEKYKQEQARLEIERQKLIQRRDELRRKIQEIRERSEMLRMEQMHRNEQYRIMNMDYLRNIIIAMRYQNGVEIDPDNMTYEELLQLEEKMGTVCKGFNEQQLASIQRRAWVEADGEVLCSICYCNVKEGEQINQLPCKHCFHCECIKEWLLKQRVCPMCKQEIVLNVMKSIKSIKVIRDAETKKSDCVDVKGEESILNNEEVMEAPEGELVEGETEQE